MQQKKLERSMYVLCVCKTWNKVINADFLKQALEIKYGEYKSIKDIFRCELMK